MAMLNSMIVRRDTGLIVYHNSKTMAVTASSCEKINNICSMEIFLNVLELTVNAGLFAACADTRCLDACIRAGCG